MAYDSTKQMGAGASIDKRSHVVDSVNAELERLIKRLRQLDDQASCLVNSLMGVAAETSTTEKLNAVSSTTQDYLRELDDVISRLEFTIGRAY